MSDIQFEPVRMSGQTLYRERFEQTPEKASDYTFTNIWGWAEEYGLEWSFGETHVFLRQTRPELLYWAPIGPWDKVEFWRNCRFLQDPKTFIRVPESLALRWKQELDGRVEIEEARGQWDYVYSVPELVELKGNRFHKKKNLLNQFLKKYDAVYKPMDMTCVEEAMELQLEWCQWKECESHALDAENTAVKRILQDWDRLDGLVGGSLHVDHVMIAYTVAERLSDEALVVHIEKGKPEYKGVYQAINQMFLECQNGKYALVNREQDLEEEGLRKSKLSYNPVEFLKKYTVRVS